MPRIGSASLRSVIRSYIHTLVVFEFEKVRLTQSLLREVDREVIVSLIVAIIEDARICG